MQYIKFDQIDKFKWLPNRAGVVREIARQIFDVEISMRVLERRQETIDANEGEFEEHVVFKICEVIRNGRSQAVISRSSLTLASELFKNDQLQLNLKDLANIFPYHICFDKSLKIQHCGTYIQKSCARLILHQSLLTDILHMVHPEIPMTFDNFIHFINGTFVFKIRQVDDLHSDVKSQATIQVKGRWLWSCGYFLSL